MTNGREKKYNRCQESYPHSLSRPQVYDFLIGRRAGNSVALRVASLFGVGEGILFGDDGRFPARKQAPGAPNCARELLVL